MDENDKPFHNLYDGKKKIVRMILIFGIILIISFYLIIFWKSNISMNKNPVSTTNNMNNDIQKNTQKLADNCEKNLLGIVPEIKDMKFKTFYSSSGIGGLMGNYMVNSTLIGDPTTGSFGNVLFSWSNNGYTHFDGCHFIFYNPHDKFYDRIKYFVYPMKLNCSNGIKLQYKIGKEYGLNMLIIDITGKMNNKNYEKFMEVYTTDMNTLNKILDLNKKGYGC